MRPCVLTRTAGLRRRHASHPRPEFLARALHGIGAAGLSATTRIDCILVGSIDPLHEEIVREQFAVGPDGRTPGLRRRGLLRALRGR
jgi:hypothetical protein